MRRIGAPAAAVACLMVLALAACAPSTPKAAGSASPTSTHDATPTATPTPTASPLPDGVLFQITTTATAPDGTAATLTEVVHTPVAKTTTQAGDEVQLDNECDGWRQAFSSTQFLVADVTAALPAGTSWSATDGQIAVDMGGYPVWSGDQQPYQALCATALAVVPGSARAVSPVGGGKPDSDGGWAVFRYGFGVPTASATATPAPGGVVFSHCKVQLGAAASNSVFASAWPGHPETDGGSACRVGGAD